MNYYLIHMTGEKKWFGKEENVWDAFSHGPIKIRYSCIWSMSDPEKVKVVIDQCKDGI